MSGLNYLFVGADNPEAFMIGNDEVEVIYMGEEIVYQKGDFEGIQMKSDVSIAMASGSTYDLKINSSEPWTLSVDTAVTWLEFSQLTGGTGETIVTITTTEENQTGSDRSTTITATTANYSATCVVNQISVHYVEFIHKSTLENSTNYYIDTGIFPTTATKMRFVYMGKGMIARGKFLGFSWGGEEDVYKGATDDSDYRYFGANSHIYWDYNNSRLENGNFNNYSNGVLYDVEIGNNYVKNNLDGTMIVNGTAQTNPPASNIPIMVNVSCIWLKSLQIWEGQTLVFDGQAAIDEGNNIIGLYDSVSNTWKYNPNIQMSYEIDNLPISWSSSGNTTQADYEVDSHLYQDFHFCTLRLKETIGTSICYYYYRVYITTDHKVEVRQYSSTAILLYLSLGYGESGELRTDVARNCFISHNSSGNGTFANVTFECNDYQLNGMDYHWDFSYQA